MLICLTVQYQIATFPQSLSEPSSCYSPNETQMPFLICHQFALRCPLLMGEDSKKMGFSEAKMSSSHTNEAGVTGLECQVKTQNLKMMTDLPLQYRAITSLCTVRRSGLKRCSTPFSSHIHQFISQRQGEPELTAQSSVGEHKLRL